MSKSVLVIGAVALGPKAACRIKRLDPSVQVTMIDQDEFISYGGCGMPYYLSGEVSTIDALRSTSAQVIRDPDFFEEIKNVHVKNNTKALKIDRQAKTVLVRNLKTNQEESLSYDKLVLATGATPRKLTVTGSDLKGVSCLSNLHEAKYIQEICASGKVKNAVIIGAGFIGLEVAIALADMWGINTTIVEVLDQVLPGVVSPNLAQMALKDLNDLGVTVYTSEKVQALNGQNGTVSAVVTDKRTLEADLVISSIGFIPNTSLAQEAGLKCIANGAILVDEYMRSSDPDIYAGGDCVSIKNLLTGKDGYLPLGSLANRQGRIVANNICADYQNSPKDKFPGYVGNWCVKLNKMNVAGVGLSITKAKQEGFDAVSVNIEGDDKAHFYPEAIMTSLELVVEKKTRRILGLQGLSANGDSLKARIDAVAMLLQYGQATIDNLSNAEICYAPPFASAMDIINSVANVADNVLANRLLIIEPSEFLKLWEKRQENNYYFLDARPAHKPALAIQNKFPEYWHVIPLEELKKRKHEIPKDRKIAIICSSGLRAYETVLELSRSGYDVLGSSMGGMQSIKKRGQDIV